MFSEGYFPIEVDTLANSVGEVVKFYKGDEQCYGRILFSYSTKENLKYQFDENITAVINIVELKQNGRKFKAVKEAIETDDCYSISAFDLIKIVPSGFFPTSKKLNQLNLYRTLQWDEDDVCEECLVICGYKAKMIDIDDQLLEKYPALYEFYKVDPPLSPGGKSVLYEEEISPNIEVYYTQWNLEFKAGKPIHDYDHFYIEVLKKFLFDPFVSPTCISSRRCGVEKCRGLFFAIMDTIRKVGGVPGGKEVEEEEEGGGGEGEVKKSTTQANSNISYRSILEKLDDTDALLHLQHLRSINKEVFVKHTDEFLRKLSLSICQIMNMKALNMSFIAMHYSLGCFHHDLRKISDMPYEEDEDDNKERGEEKEVEEDDDDDDEEEEETSSSSGSDTSDESHSEEEEDESDADSGETSESDGSYSEYEDDDEEEGKGRQHKRLKTEEDTTIVTNNI